MKKNKSYLLIAAVLAFLFTLTPTKILAQENIIDRLDKSLGVKLPTEYEAKVRELIKNNNVFKVIGADDFTAQFIENQMKVDWKIDKQNQLVFLWHCIYKQIIGEDLYNPEDGDSNRLQDFNDRVVGMRIRAAGQRYKEEIIAYMDKVIAEADRQIAEADRQIAEADRQIAEADRQIAEAKQLSAEARQQSLNNITAIFKELINYYKLAISYNELNKLEIFKPNVEDAIEVSKHFGFDYKAIIHELCGNETEVEKGILKYFKIE